MVDKNRATGGGDVPTLDWRVWGDEWSEDSKGIPVFGRNIARLYEAFADGKKEGVLGWEEADKSGEREERAPIRITSAEDGSGIGCAVVAAMEVRRRREGATEDGEEEEKKGEGGKEEAAKSEGYGKRER